MAEKRATAAAGVIFRHQTHANIFQWPGLHCKKVSSYLWLLHEQSGGKQNTTTTHTAFSRTKSLLQKNSTITHFLSIFSFSGPPTFSKCADNSTHCQPALTATSGSAQTNPVQNDGQSMNQQELLHQVKRNIVIIFTYRRVPCSW